MGLGNLRYLLFPFGLANRYRIRRGEGAGGGDYFIDEDKKKHTAVIPVLLERGSGKILGGERGREVLEVPGDPGGRQVVNLIVGGRVKVGKRKRKENSGTGGHKKGPVRARVTSVTGEAVINRENGDKIPAPVRKSAVNTQRSPVFAGIAQGIANSRVDDFNDLRETPVKKSGVIFVGNELDASVGEPAGRVKSVGTSLEAAGRSRGFRVDPGFFKRGQGEARRRREGAARGGALSSACDAGSSAEGAAAASPIQPRAIALRLIAVALMCMHAAATCGADGSDPTDRHVPQSRARSSPHRRRQQVRSYIYIILIASSHKY